MSQQFNYQCLNCGATHTSEEWNDATFKHLSAYDIKKSWRDDENFIPIEVEFEIKEGAWFYCPSCNDMRWATTRNEIRAIVINLDSNVAAKHLLSKEY